MQKRKFNSKNMSAIRFASSIFFLISPEFSAKKVMNLMKINKNSFHLTVSSILNERNATTDNLYYVN